jgi:hypothetical protein
MQLPATLLPAQKKFVYSPSRLSAYYGGVGNGKSAAGCLRGMMLSDKFPGNFGLVGRLYLPELRDTTMKDFLDLVRQRNGGTLNPGKYVKFFNKAERHLELQNGSTIVFRYLADYENILSLNLGWFYIDQAEFVPEATYLALESRLRYWTADNIAKCRKDHALLYGTELKHRPTEYGFITGNPAPGWVMKRYKHDTSGRYHLVEAPTGENAKNLPVGYEAGLRATYPASYVRRFLDGDWTVFQGMVYDEYDPSIHNIYEIKIEPYWPCYIGVDVGTDNPTAFVFVFADDWGNLIVAGEVYRTGSIIKDHANAVKSYIISRGFTVPRSEDGRYIVTHMDPSIAQAKDAQTGRNHRMLYQDFGIVGLPANKDVPAGVTRIRQLMHPDPDHEFPPWHPMAGQKGSPHLFFLEGEVDNVLRELPEYEWERRKDGDVRNQTERPVKKNDHALDAKRYAIMAHFDHEVKKPKSEKRKTYEQVMYDKMTENTWQTNPTGEADPALTGGEDPWT